mgnify:CR=1 FL=1
MPETCPACGALKRSETFLTAGPHRGPVMTTFAMAHWPEHQMVERTVSYVCGAVLRRAYIDAHDPMTVHGIVAGCGGALREWAKGDKLDGNYGDGQ